MKIILSKEEWDICADFLIQNLDFDKLYDRCDDTSKEWFSKELIISSIKKLIKKYPNFDESVKGRIESNSSTLSVTMGYLNGYMFIIDGDYHKGWIMTTDKLFEIIKKQKNDNVHHYLLDTKSYLRNLKIKKICQISTKNTK